MNLFLSTEVIFDQSKHKFYKNFLCLLQLELSETLNIVLISHNDQKGRYLIDHLKNSNLEFSANLYFYNRSNKSEIIKFIDINPGKNIFIGPKNVDMYNATHFKLLYLCSMWSNKIEDKAKTYGTKVYSFKELIEVLKILNIHNNFYYTLKVDDKTTVHALTSANTWNVSESENKIISIFKKTLKEGNQQYLSAVMLYLISTLMDNDELKNVDIWGIMPSSGTAINDDLNTIKDHCRFLTGNKLNQDLLIRHTPTEKSHYTPKIKRLEIGAKKHLKTIHINPYFKNKIKGKTVCIIDDYLTNGISFEAIRNLLEKAGASKIFLIAIGRYRSKDSQGKGNYQKEDYTLSDDIYTTNIQYELNNRDGDFGCNGAYNESARKCFEKLNQILEQK